MGFRLNRVYDLTFSGQLDGLEVRIRSTPIGVVLDLIEADLEATIGALVEYVESWNLDASDGSPLPVDRDAILREVEKPLVMAICQAWLRVATQVPIPLGDESTSGEQSPEESIPTEVL